MNVTCYPSVLSGTVAAIPSKSDLHRKLICAALSENGGALPLREPYCDDIAATVRCLQALGAEFQQTTDRILIAPIKQQPHADLDCGESGSTLRFLLPVAMAVCSNISVTGHGRLPERPIGTLTNAMYAHGVHFDETHLPLHANGNLRGGVYEIEGNVSSQFLSGLLMALPLCREDSEIRLTTALQSAAYVDLTLRVLREFGAEIYVSTKDLRLCYHILGKQRLHMPEGLSVDGDWSNAAFWLTAGAVQQAGNAAVCVTGLDTASTQGDRAILRILRESGAAVQESAAGLSVTKGQNRCITEVMDAIPDLLPILAVKAAVSEGNSEFVKAERLRLKESDRLQSTAQMLRDLGGNVDERADGLTVYGGQLRGGTVNAQNDHRLVMAAAIAALCCREPVTILGAEAVNKSYPQFFDDYIALGGKITIPEGGV